MAIEHIDGKLSSAETLAAFLSALFVAAGADAESSDAVTRAVVDASSRGVDTHGVRLVPWYLQMLEGGAVNRHPKVTFTQKGPAAGHVDSDNGFGHRASFMAIDEGCQMARRTGVAAITVGRSTHHGATGVYARAAARKGFVAMGMTHADKAVVPFGGLKPFYGTNPLAFAAPVPGEEPLLLDMATSSIPFNRVLLRRATNTPLPPEVAVDADGAMTNDANQASAVLPLGGADYAYKGAGIAAMIDILCSAFTGMGHGATFASFGGPDFSQPIPIGHFFLIFDPKFFQPLAAFDDRMAAFTGDLRSQPARPGQKVMAPGDIENAEAEKRRRNGIPIDRVTWDALTTSAKTYGVPVPDVDDTKVPIPMAAGMTS